MYIYSIISKGYACMHQKIQRKGDALEFCFVKRLSLIQFIAWTNWLFLNFIFIFSNSKKVVEKKIDTFILIN